jgi:hypothetical protein
VGECEGDAVGVGVGDWLGKELQQPHELAPQISE